MLDAIIRFSIRNKLIIGMFMLGLVFWGGYSLSRLPIDAVPDITNNQVQIITSAPSQSAQDIERLVTFPIEQSVATIPDMEEVRSFSRFGLSVVTVVFHDDVDIYKARQLVSERLTVAVNEIPQGVGTPGLAPISTGLGEIYQYTVQPKPGFEKKYTAMELRTIQDWIVRRQLLGVEGVAEVSSMGGYVKQYEIALNPHKLNSLGITISDVFTALESSNQNTGGAYIDKKPNAWYIRSEGLIGGIPDVEKVVVKYLDSGIPVLVRDIAKVGYGNAIRYGALTRNENREAVGAMVLMLKGANASQVIKNVKERITQINKTLPEGVVIKPFLDRTVLVNKAISTVAKNLLEGALIVIFVLVLFLGNFRAGMIVATMIPLAMLFAIALMNLFGVSGNLMSLGAIDFGLIVDGAVIIVEATLHHMGLLKLGRKLTQTEMDEEVFNSASKIRSSAAFGEIIILIVYLPILALVGVEGKMFKPMAQTVSFAILGAFILSLTYVPMMSALFLSKHTEHKRNFSDRLIDAIHRVYEPIIKKALSFPRTLVLSVVGLFVASLLLFGHLGAEFLPSLDEGDFSIETRVLSGSSVEETIDASVKASRILREQFPDEVVSVVGKIGSAEIPTDPMPIEACDLIVTLKDKSLWTKAETKDELADAMAVALEDIPGVTFGFQQPIQMRFNELMTGARQDVVVKIYGEDLDMLTSYSKKVAGIIGTINGAADLYLENMKGARQILISYDRDALARFGMRIEDINTAVNAAFAGQSAGLVYEGEKRFDLVVRLEKALRTGIEDVQNLYVKAPNGNQIPLSQVASVRFDDAAPTQIQRDDAKRRITVGFNVRGRDVESVVKELQAKVEKGIQFAPGYFPTYGGTFENLQEARGRLSIAVPVALLLIFVLLYFTFTSVKQSLLIFSAIPLSAIGGVVALWLRDMPFSISAGVGFIALFGVAVLNGIVLIGELNSLQKAGVTDVRERILKATQTRLRPVVMTAAVASLGFLPMALSHGSGAEVQKPLATVVIGGLLTATLLTLVILPCIYYLTNRPKTMRKKKALPKAAGLLLIGLLLTPFGFAQTTLSLDSALQVAYTHNKSLKARSNQVTYYDQLRKTGSSLPKTDVSVMVGQYNSYYKGDNNVTISQTIPFPTVFVAKSRLTQSQGKGASLALEVSRNEITFEIRQLYNQSAYWNSYKALLLKEDSLLFRIAKATDLNFRTGEGSLLQKTTAETRLNEVRNKQKLADAELHGIARKLQFFLGVDYPVRFENAELHVIATIPVTDTIKLKANPQAQYLEQQVVIAENEHKLEKNTVLPDLKVGYFNQTLYGTQLAANTTQLAGRTDRFQGFQVGLTIPLWFGPELHKSKAAAINREVKNAEYEHYVVGLQSEYEKTLQMLQSNRSLLEYYSGAALPNAELIETQSVKSFELGEINFTTHLLNIQQTIAIREGYLNAINEHNVNLLYLNYLMAE